MQDGVFRRTIKKVAALCYALNLRGTRAAWRLQREHPYELGGACQGCGACCVNPSIQVGRFLWYFPTARHLFLLWQRLVNGFELVERHIPGRVFVFRCTHFDTQTRRCDSYDSRPGMCRDYPRVLLWQPSPSFLAECSHYPIAPGADRFLEALKREGLDEEKLQKVKEKLFLNG